MIAALILFAATYVLMLVFSKYRPYIALASAVIFIVSGMLSFENIFGAIDFNGIGYGYNSDKLIILGEKQGGFTLAGQFLVKLGYIFRKGKLRFDELLISAD